MAHPTHGEHDLKKLGWQWYVKLGPTVSLGVMNWTMLNIHYLMMLLYKLTNHGSAVLRRFFFIFLLYFNVKLWMQSLPIFSWIYTTGLSKSLQKFNIFWPSSFWDCGLSNFHFLNNLPLEEKVALHLNNWNSLHLMIFCTKFVWKLAL